MMQRKHQSQRTQRLHPLTPKPKTIDTFSPPDKLEIFFQLFFGGITLNKIPSENGSKLSTSSNSAFPPIVIIWYISFNRKEIMLKPCINSSRRRLRRSSQSFLAESRVWIVVSRSLERSLNSVSRRWYSSKALKSTLMFWMVSKMSAAVGGRERGDLRGWR